jgi:hypothetical protein
MIARSERTLVAALAVVCWPVGAAAQVQTEVPPVVDGAKPVAVERISIHGTSLEGNLEGHAFDREALVSSLRATQRRRPAGARSSTRCTATRLAPSSGPRRFTCRRRSRARSRTAPAR